MIGYLLLFVIIFIITSSLRTLFVPTALQEKYLSWESFIYLIFIFSTIFLGFGLIYFIFIQNGFTILLVNGNEVKDTITSLHTCFYFSGLTLFSVGYGDVVPVGIGRGIAIIEALIGYTVPASFIVRTVVDFRKERG
ncbi:ion channel [Caldibacillus thermoamylovorans]|uniref:ion channel n=1 Tax=Caldibacillus thermoamylovorans TaxID=35841 RepID=UPI0020409E53|nr:ion channel [Caldibacillus thermoamylovorans]MCM3477993.1 ion channel [Caldibacillus thermoamylovorans]